MRVLINVSRGAVVDTAALIAALNARKIGGAALDVFDVQPLPADSPLFDCPNLLLTPHVAGITASQRPRDARRRRRGDGPHPARRSAAQSRQPRLQGNVRKAMRINSHPVRPDLLSRCRRARMSGSASAARSNATPCW